MSLIAVIGDEDTVTGMLLAGVGHKNAAGQNYLVVNDKTTRAQIEEAFTNYTKKRPDVAIVLINQHVASSIRYLIDAHKETIPTVLEIPSKDRKSSLVPCFPQFHRVCLCEGYPPPLTFYIFSHCLVHLLLFVRRPLRPKVRFHYEASQLDAWAFELRV
jgi:V-type H+-transporting ATPase subunit F